MKLKKYTPPAPLILEAGHFIELDYDGYEEMDSSSENWEHYCTYKLLPNALKGHHQVLQLHSMQLSCVQRPGGLMYASSSAKDCITFAVIAESSGKACFDNIKLEAGDILFFDDSHPFSFMTSGAFKLCAITMQKEKMGDILPEISNALYHIIKDTDAVMSKTLYAIWEQYTNKSDANKGANTYKDTEEKIKNVLMKLLRKQTPTLPKLTKGEKKVLAIRDQIQQHMDGKFTVKSLAKKYHMSEKTIHNSFKSLFGFTPSYFLRQLKLNFAHQDLKKSDPKQSTVSKIAFKWGYTHMGNFSHYYTELFNENPSQTLMRGEKESIVLQKSCASRKEDITD